MTGSHIAKRNVIVDRSGSHPFADCLKFYVPVCLYRQWFLWFLVMTAGYVRVYVLSDLEFSDSESTLYCEK